MSVVEPGSTRSSLVERIKNILTRPSQTWDVIDTEPAGVGELYKGYVAPLAAIPAVFGLIGMLMFGVGVMGVSYRPPIGVTVGQTVVSYVLTLVMVYVLALVIDALAPTFGGTRSRIQAFKLAAYSGTAAWVTGVFGLLPVLGGLVGLMAGIYSLYTLYRGLPKLMKAPPEKALPYFALVLVVVVVLALLIGFVTSRISNLGGPLSLADRGRNEATVTIPGDTTINLGKLEEASKQAEAAARQMQAGQADGKLKVADPEVLKAYLPDSIVGYVRSEVSAGSGGVAGMQGSNAAADYAKGDARLKLTVTDMGAAGALAGLANAFNVKSSKESGSRYEKVGKVDGRLTTESYDKESRHGEYGVLVANRFMIHASGDGPSMDDLKAAVKAVDASRLEGLAKAG